MADEPSWEDIFTTPADPERAARPQQPTSPTTPYASPDAAPRSRREAREAEAQASGGRRPSAASRPINPPKKRGKAWIAFLVIGVLLIGSIGGVGAFAWFNYNEQVRSILGIPIPTDYEGDGNGKEVDVTIHDGDIGEDIARTLHDAGVTMTFDAFYNLLLEQKTDPEFFPGSYSLEKEMSAKSALAALLDPAKKITDRVTIKEGTILSDVLTQLASATDTPVADYEAASKDLASFGLPAEAPSLEGYLFPATYQLDPGSNPHAVLQMLVTEMFARLDKAQVPVADRHKVLTLASIIQRESGSNIDDFYKVSRVFTNRLDQGINLESDATVSYGAGTIGSVFTTDEARADASDPYNTYALPGLPIGPIGMPGDDAIDAALHPVDGPWLFFVPINLQTGETVFSETADEHEAAVQQLHDWCDASPENDSYCQ